MGRVEFQSKRLEKRGANYLVDVVDEVLHDHYMLSQAEDHLKKALNAPQSGREIDWAVWVWKSLVEARTAIVKHEGDVTGPGGLYSELEFEHPRLGFQIEMLLAELKKVDNKLSLVMEEVRKVRFGDFHRIGLIRAHAEALMLVIDRMMKMEGDLIHESLNEPMAID